MEDFVAKPAPRWVPIVATRPRAKYQYRWRANHRFVPAITVFSRLVYASRSRFSRSDRPFRVRLLDVGLERRDARAGDVLHDIRAVPCFAQVIVVYPSISMS